MKILHLSSSIKSLNFNHISINIEVIIIQSGYTFFWDTLYEIAIIIRQQATVQISRYEVNNSK